MPEDVEGPAPVAARRIKVTVPPEFKGSGESAERWFKRYEICVASNEWDEKTKLTQVKPLMGGEALDLLLDMSETELENYQTIKDRMLSEFDQKELRETYVKEFHSRTLRDSEELLSFMRALKSLARKAYPDFDDDHRNSLVEDHYKQEMPHQIRAVLPFLALTAGNLDELVRETGRLAKGVCKGVRPVAAVSEVSASAELPSAGAVGGSVTNAALMMKLQEIQERVQKMGTSHEELELRVNHLSSAPSSGRTPWNSGRQGSGERSGRSSGVICYGCKQKGHIRRDCPGMSSVSTPGPGSAKPGFFPNVICSRCKNPGHYATSCQMGN